MKVEIGTEPRNSFSGNICLEFSVLCLAVMQRNNSDGNTPHAGGNNSHWVIILLRCNEIPFMYSQKRNCAASFLTSTFLCLWAIYLIPGTVGPHTVFSYSRTGRPIAQRHMKEEIGTEPRNSFSGNICFEFSVLCRCSDAEKSFSFPRVE